MELLLAFCIILIIIILIVFYFKFLSQDLSQNLSSTLSSNLSLGYDPPGNLDLICNNAHLCVEYKDIPSREPYQKPSNLIFNKHMGQLKLFLSEVQFLTEYTFFDEKTIVIYAGSAPNNKLPLLNSLFPNVHFILIDKREHHFSHFDNYQNGDKDGYQNGDKSGSDSDSNSLYFVINEGKASKLLNFYDGRRIVKKFRKDHKQGCQSIEIIDIINMLKYKNYIIEDYLDKELASLLSRLRRDINLLFISDIRTAQDGKDPSTLDILWNSAQMINWLNIIKPKYYMLKFRCPFNYDANLDIIPEYMNDDFFECPVDFLKNYRNKKFIFLDNIKINIQAFAPNESAETRLIGQNLNFIEYDILSYEEKMYFYNSKYRPFGWHTNHTKYLDFDLGIDRCGDCALMCHILEKYCSKFSSKFLVHDILKQFLSMGNRDLFGKYNLHGEYYRKLLMQKNYDNSLKNNCIQILRTALDKNDISHRERPLPISIFNRNGNENEIGNDDFKDDNLNIAHLYNHVIYFGAESISFKKYLKMIDSEIAHRLSNYKNPYIPYIPCILDINFDLTLDRFCHKYDIKTVAFISYSQDTPLVREFYPLNYQIKNYYFLDDSMYGDIESDLIIVYLHNFGLDLLFLLYKIIMNNKQKILFFNYYEDRPYMAKDLYSDLYNASFTINSEEELSFFITSNDPTSALELDFIALRDCSKTLGPV